MYVVNTVNKTWTAWTWTNNKPNPHVTGSALNPGHRGGRWALSTLPPSPQLFTLEIKSWKLFWLLICFSHYMLRKAFQCTQYLQAQKVAACLMTLKTSAYSLCLLLLHHPKNHIKMDVSTRVGRSQAISSKYSDLTLKLLFYWKTGRRGEMVATRGSTTCWICFIFRVLRQQVKTIQTFLVECACKQNPQNLYQFT